MKSSVLTTRTWMLLIAAGLLVAAGVLNVVQRAKHQTPAKDGVNWTDTKEGILAASVEPNSAAGRAYVLPGDRLLVIKLNGGKEEVTQARYVQIYLEQARVGGEIHYLIERPSYPPESRYYWADLDHLASVNSLTVRDLYLNLIGLVYLFIGLFVIFRQGGRAPFVVHFAGLCLAAFVFHFYTPLGTYRDLDLAIAFLDSAALILFAPLLLHFSAIYPVRYHLFEDRRWRSVALYLPAFVLLGFTTVIFLHDQLTKIIPHQLLDYSPNFVARFYKV